MVSAFDIIKCCGKEAADLVMAAAKTPQGDSPNDKTTGVFSKLIGRMSLSLNLTSKKHVLYVRHEDIAFGRAIEADMMIL